MSKSAIQDNVLNESINLSEALLSWSQQKGYPILIVERDYDKNSVMLRQRRYLTPKSAVNDNTTWWIPYNYVTARNPNFVETTTMDWLNPREYIKIIAVNATLNDWLIFNKQQTGFYRILYDKHNYKLLIKQLNSDNFAVIHRLNRAQLLDDSFDFVGQKVLPIATFFRLFNYLKRETDFAPWHVANNIASNLIRLLRETNIYQRLRSHIAELLNDPYNRIGVENHWNEAILLKQTREIIINLACQFGVTACERATHLQLKLVLFNNYTLHPNMYVYVYGNGIRNATDKEVNVLWHHFNKTLEKDERSAIIAGFGRIQNRTLLQDYLRKTIEDDNLGGLSRAERMTLFVSIVESSEYGLLLGIDLIKRYPLDAIKRLSNLDNIVTILAKCVTTPNARTKVSSILCIYI